MKREKDRAALSFGMTLSLLVGVMMLVMKVGAYLLTGSAAILSDAAESVVHVVAVGFAFYSLRLSYKPADEDHHYGHDKISFFSAGFEGSMIVIAALYIIYEAIHKWVGGLALENLGIGTLITALAALINGFLGYYLLRMGKNRHSIVLEANGRHVLTDCWTSLGVLVGLGLTMTTGWLPWDPIFAILVAINILISGAGLIRRSLGGLMDRADPAVHRQLVAILDEETAARNILYHDLRHRCLGDMHWVEVHLLFPKNTSIQHAHQMATAIENVIQEKLEPGAYVSTHLESIEDHASVHEKVEH